MPLKEIKLMPSTIETIDTAMYEFINDHLNLFASTKWDKIIEYVEKRSND